MTEKKRPSPKLRNQASRTHLAFQRKQASALTYGRFYTELLRAGVWATQSELAAGLQVSKAQVSKTIKAAKLPPEVLRVFGPEERISFRVAETIAGLTSAIGPEDLVRRARKIGTRSDLPVAELLDCLARGSTPSDEPKFIKMSVGRGGRYIRIESPDIGAMIARLDELETALNIALHAAGCRRR